MSEEQSPTGKEGASVDARRRTHQMGCASCARPYVGTDLIRIVGSWVLPLIVQHSAFGALVKAAIPKIETSSHVSQALLGGFAPALGMTETVGRSLMAGQFVVWGLTNLTQAQVLVGLSVWRSLVLSDLGVSTGVLLASCTADVVRLLQDSCSKWSTALFRRWSAVADFGVGLARVLARAAALFLRCEPEAPRFMVALTRWTPSSRTGSIRSRPPGVVAPWSWCCSTASGSPPTAGSVVTRSWARSSASPPRSPASTSGWPNPAAGLSRLDAGSAGALCWRDAGVPGRDRR